MADRVFQNQENYSFLKMRSISYLYLYLYLYYIFRRICWKAIDKDEPARYINIADIYDLALGCNTTDIMKKHNIPNGIILLYVYIYIYIYIKLFINI
jgi:hypothetical protein